MEAVGRRNIIKMEENLCRGRNQYATGEILVKKLTIDSLVIISSLLENEQRHKEALVGEF
jgi:hypothetical protein